MTQYTPTHSDVTWAKSVLLYIKDGGTWICDVGACTISHTDKTITLFRRNLESGLDTEEEDEFWNMTAGTFGYVGYTFKTDIK